MLSNDSFCNHTSVGKIVMDGRLLSSAVLWLSPITQNDGSLKYDHVRGEYLLYLSEIAAVEIEESLLCYNSQLFKEDLISCVQLSTPW